jgi:hypothetical protein
MELCCKTDEEWLFMQRRNFPHVTERVGVGVIWLITCGCKIDRGSNKILRSQVSKEGEDWFKPALNIHTDFDLIVTQFSICFS